MRTEEEEKRLLADYVDIESILDKYDGDNITITINSVCARKIHFEVIVEDI